MKVFHFISINTIFIEFLNELRINKVKKKIMLWIDLIFFSPTRNADID